MFSSASIFSCDIEFKTDFSLFATTFHCRTLIGSQITWKHFSKSSHNGWLDTAVVCHCCHFVLLRRMKLLTTGCPKKIVPRLCGCYGVAVGSIISIFTWCYRSGFKLEFETLHESFGQVVADLWQRKDKISGCFKNSTSIVLQQCQNQVSFQRKDFGIVSKFSPHFLKGRQYSLMNRQNC